MSAVHRPALRVIATATGATTVLSLAGDLDLATAGQLRGHTREILQGGAIRRLVLDLGGLEFMDVTGLNVLVETQGMLSADGGTLALRSPRPMVLRMLKLLGLDEVVLVE